MLKRLALVRPAACVRLHACRRNGLSDGADDQRDERRHERDPDSSHTSCRIASTRCRDHGQARHGHSAAGEPGWRADAAVSQHPATRATETLPGRIRLDLRDSEAVQIESSILQLATHERHDPILRRLKLRTTGRQSGGRDSSSVSRRNGAVARGEWRRFRGRERWHAGVLEVEARAPREAR